ncbi:hypothetical protein [Pseudoalteromonas sp. BDTF-M6]|uniref:hypothetical protein n=1 Tax=Pseudoalteromonas sp. BDTF-M6 TaxID=2796132 RepID=UPI001BB04E18|nr:hypothetical protein [Pseudoalteromonas sp. BDTF-M6]MBS3798705.1 hypothetical protein [Pseudoalteromonas sp. BDTF-M6]
MRYQINTKEVTLYPALPPHIVKDSFITYLYWIVTAFRLEIRAIDQLVAKLNACLRVANDTFRATNKKQYVNFFTLIIALVEFDRDEETFRLHSDTFNAGSHIHIKSKFSSIVVDENTAYETSSSTKFDKIYEIMMHYSYEYRLDVSQRRPDLGIINVLGNNNKTRIPRPEGKIAEAVLESLNEFLQRYHEEQRAGIDVKLWLWKDYKTIAKLAGKLE